MSADVLPARRPFTVDEVLRMVEVGVLGEHDPIELIDGELIQMSPQGPAHGGLTVLIRQRLEQAFGPGHHVRDHSPVALGPTTLPEPDLAVVRGDVDFRRHPSGDDLALVVEISVTSQVWDQAKAAVYARGGVPEYWIVDVPRRRVTVYREPRPELGGYAVATVAGPEDTVTVGGTTIAVADLLPPG